MYRRIPQIAFNLLHWFADSEWIEEIEGDLEEQYAAHRDRWGERLARLFIWKDTLLFLRPYLRRRNHQKERVYGPIMFKHYLKSASRSLSKGKLYSVLNIAGLTIGITCFILIGRYIQYELSYDHFFENADRIHRLAQQQPGNSFLGSDYAAITPAPLARTISDEYPEVLSSTTVDDATDLLVAGDRTFLEVGLSADNSFLDVFSYPIQEGNPNTMLAEPRSIVLTAPLAVKLFPNMDPMGMTVHLQSDDDYTVTGIIDEPPPQSHLQFSYITSIISSEDYRENLDNWDSSSWWTYFVLSDGHAGSSFQAKMPALLDKYRPPLEDVESDMRQRLIVQRLVDIHLYSNFNFEISANGDIKYIYLFGGIGIIILLLACINYTNLAVARSVRRSREVGLRKVVGARRTQVITQFMTESFLFAAISIALSVVFVSALLPVFGVFVERDLSVNSADVLSLGLPLLAVLILVGVIGGGYPSLFVSKLKPAQMLKGSTNVLFSRGRGRRTLVIGQIAVSIVLVVGSLVIFRQLRYVQNAETGFDREHIVTVRMQDQELRLSPRIIQDELLKHPNIIRATSLSSLPTNISSRTSTRGKDLSGASKSIRIYQASVGYDYFDVFDMSIVMGSKFTRAMRADTASAVILNEAAMSALGWDSIENKYVTRYRNPDLPVVGVVKNFNQHSLHREIEPLMLVLSEAYTRTVSVKITSRNIPDTIAYIEDVFSRFSPYPFQYEFLDDAYDRLYKNEIKLGQSVLYFTLLALFIAALGLFGLAAYSAEQRVKEIGIRKAVGASVSSVVLLLSRELGRIIVVAFIVSAPVAYILASRWLDDFAYRIEIGPGTFIVTLAAIVTVAWLSVSYQAIRAARANPVDALKHE